jgi:hypothetical protein
MPASRLASLPAELAAAIARLLDPAAKAALRRACKALQRAVDAAVTAVTIGQDLALPPPALFPHLSAIRFGAGSDEQLRGLAPALAALPSLASLRTPHSSRWQSEQCLVTAATLEALAAACPRLRELDLGGAGGSSAAAAACLGVAFSCWQPR